MNIREQLHKVRYGPICNIGGDKKQSTSNSAANYDNRSVLTDSYNTYDLSDRSTTNTAWTDASNTSYDLSNRSVNNTTSTSNSNNTSAYDLSNRSVTNTSTANAWADSSNSNNSYDLSNRSTTTTNNSSDNSNRSVNNTWTTTTDGGAVAGALSFAGSSLTGMAGAVKDALGFATSVASGQQAATVHAYDFADGLFDGALSVLNANAGRAYDAYDRAALIEKDALAMSGAASKAALDQVQNAYADAKGTTQSQQKIMLGVLAVAAVAVLARARG